METSVRWDPEKARSNARKHGITFDEGASVFRDSLSATIGDPMHSTWEDRFVTVGRSLQNRILVMVHSEVGESIRIINARLATRNERRKYEEGAF